MREFGVAIDCWLFIVRRDFLGNFARTGDPNGDTTPDWRQFAARPTPSTELMQLGGSSSSGRDDSGSDGSARMAALSPAVVERYTLLAEQYFGKFVKGQVAQHVPMNLEKGKFSGYGWRAPGQAAEPRRNPQDQILVDIRKKSRL
eukprot:COSAG06_NODE_3679_length_5024_cov_1.865787_3_plen_145_part_00